MRLPFLLPTVTLMNGWFAIAAEVAEARVVVTAPADEHVVLLRDPPVAAQRAREQIERRFVGGQARKVGRADPDRGVLLRLLDVAEPEETIAERRPADVGSE